jgi:hypothetical protein
MTDREEMISILAGHEGSEPLLNFLAKTRATLEAMTEDELRALMEPAATFQEEAGALQMRAADLMMEYRALRFRPCAVYDLARRAQRLRDVEQGFDRVQPTPAPGKGIINNFPPAGAP